MEFRPSPSFLIKRAAFCIGAEAIVEVHRSAAHGDPGGRQVARILIDDHEFLVGTQADVDRLKSLTFARIGHIERVGSSAND